jgi:hypothetical protein
MKATLVLALALGLLLAHAMGSPQSAAPDWAVYFSPDGGATRAIVEEFGRAKAPPRSPGEISTA